VDFISRLNQFVRFIVLRNCYEIVTTQFDFFFMSSARPHPAFGPKHSLIVSIGEFKVSGDVRSEIVTHSLGSCVGVTLYDPVTKVGGMLHALLPASSISRSPAERLSHKYVDSGLIGLFHAIYALGGHKRRLEVRLAGGGDFLDEKKLFRIGEKNVAAVRQLLARNDVKLAGEHVGGHFSRTLRLQIASGKVTMDIPGQRAIAI
jgi:chemotaxis protein CheD